MFILRAFLAFLLPILIFFVLPIAGGGTQTNLYEPRLYIVPTAALIGLLIYYSTVSKGKSIVRFASEFKPKVIHFYIFSYIFFVLMSAVFSPMPGYAWLGFPAIQFGAVLIISSFILLFLYSKLDVIGFLLPIIITCSVIMTLFTVAESLGFRPLAQWISSGVMSYPAAFIGHRPHLGGWFSIICLVPLYLFRNRKLSPVFWIWIVSNFIGLSLSTTTAATIGVASGIIVWLSVKNTNFYFRRKVIIVSIFIFTVFSLPIAAKLTSEYFNLQEAQFKNYASLNNFRTRPILWKSALNGAIERPYFGWGDETFAFEVFEHLEPNDAKDLIRTELALSGSYNVIYKGFTYYVSNDSGKTDGEKDRQTGSLLYIRAHNIIFDEMYSHGFPALFLGILIIVTSLRRLRKMSKVNFLPMLAALIPYCIYLQAWFYVPTVTPFFFMTLGIIFADYRNTAVLEAKK